MTASAPAPRLADTVHGAVIAYVGSARVAMPLDQLRDDIAKIVQQHETVESVTTTTPRGHHGACDMQVFGWDGQQIAHVTIDSAGIVEALPAPEDAVARAQPVAAPTLDERRRVAIADLTPEWTPLDWHCYIRAAGNFAHAGDRMQEAADAGVDFAAMTAAAEGR